MRIVSTVRQLLADLQRQRLRTALTILGISWGTTAVVTLLAFGVGLEHQMKRNARGMGDNIVVVFGGTTTRAFQGFTEGRRIRLHWEDAALLEEQVPGIEHAVGEYGRWGVRVRRRDKGTSIYLTGVPPVYGELRNVFTEPGGRFINALDVEGRRRVAVLGDEIKRILFGDEDAVGQQVFLGRTPFTVVGVMRPKTQNSSYNARDEDRVFIPYTTYQAVFSGTYVRNLVYRPHDPAASPAVNQQVRDVLGRRYTFDPEDHDAVALWDLNESMKFFGYLFLGFNLFLGIVGSFTLVVGGVGVANIMYVVVQERTREIGIRRSVGARRRDILLRMLLEAVFIVALGAGLGFALSWGIVALVGTLPIEEFVGRPTISPLVVGVTTGLLTAIAVLAGLLPARRAANLDPVTCLRYGL